MTLKHMWLKLGQEKSIVQPVLKVQDRPATPTNSFGKLNRSKRSTKVAAFVESCTTRKGSAVAMITLFGCKDEGSRKTWNSAPNRRLSHKGAST